MLPRIALLFAVIVWGWTFVATKVCLAHVTPVELLALRLVLALPVLALILLARRLPLFPGRSWRPVLVGGLIMTAHFLIQITGIGFTSATNSGWIIAVTPLVIALLAAMWLRETLSRRLLAGIAIATLGVVLLVSRGELGGLGWLRSPGDWLVLASAHTWAFYTLTIRDVARASHPLTVTLWVLVPPAVISFGVVAGTSEISRFAALPGDAWVALLFLGIPGMALAQWAWQEGVARVGAAEAGVFLYLEPLSTTALAVPYLGEPLGPFTVIGGLLVLLGVATVQWRRRPPGRRKATAAV